MNNLIAKRNDGVWELTTADKHGKRIVLMGTDLTKLLISLGQRV